MIGRTISHYKILEELGEGGMGVVYKAEDTKLKRSVALKFLSPHLVANEPVKKRFLHEAQAAAGLSHPHICTVHEIHEADGHTFMVMEYIEGESLREKIASGPLLVEEALDIAVKVARGLAKAHGVGVIHRDIKPGNILITPERQPKVVDFGLAKLATQTRITRTGMAVGTVVYMSPEQARGQEVDHRTDIWSMGAMLYEMLTGRLPFRGGVEQAVLYSIMNDEPKPVTSVRGDVPVAIEDIIEKALSKDPVKRHATMDEFLSELETQLDQITLGIKERRFRALRRLKRRKRMAVAVMAGVALVAVAVVVQVFRTRSGPIDSVVVLPFAYLSGEDGQEYFSDGMTEALINELQQIGALRVISRTSAMRYKETDKPLPEIARELNVDAVVEASVFRSGDKVQIRAQLIRANPERQIWAESYERDARDVLSLHSEVARAIASEIQITLTPQEQERLTSVRVVSPEAYELYLKGMHLIDNWTLEAHEKAVEYFQRAVEVDPDYAEAYAALAHCYMYFGFVSHLTYEEVSSRVTAFTKKALDIDDTLAEPHYALGCARFYMDWDWAGGLTELKRAIELNPSNAEAHAQYAWMLMTTDRSEEAFAEAELGLQLDPVAYRMNMTMAWMYYLAGQSDQAIAHYGQMAELYPNHPSLNGQLAYIYGFTGRYEEAVRALQKAMTLSGAREGDPPEEVAAEAATLDSAYSESGPDGYWKWNLTRLKGRYERNPSFIAMLYAQLDDKDQAFAWLEKAFEKRDGLMFRLKVEPCWEPLRDDPRYNDLLRRMNFPEINTSY